MRQPARKRSRAAQQCIATLRTIGETMDAAEFIGTFKFGGMPLEVAQRSMKLFATEVMPHIRRGTSPATANLSS